MKTRMDLRKLTFAALLIAIGFVFRTMTPPLLFGMKPDLLLSMMFVAIMFCDDYKMTLAIGGVVGILTAATTTFPNGQIPNIIDKLITCQCVFIASRFVNFRFIRHIKMPIIAFFGTILSGTLFLNIAAILFGAGGKSFALLLMSVVIPAAILNTILSTVVFSALAIALRRTTLTRSLNNKAA